MSGITEAERHQYFQVFTSLGPSPSGHLSGTQARNWLLNSNLPVQWLEKIWDLCDIDKDGQLDFEEFAVTYRLVKDLLDRSYTSVPSSLPSRLIPPSKAHLLGGGGGFSGSNSSLGLSNTGMYSQSMSPIPQSISPIPQTNIGQIQQGIPNIVPSYQISQHLPQSIYGSFPTAPLSDDFDWYMPPADKFNYENEYSRNIGPHVSNFDDLYQRLGIPREQCIAAWSMVDVNFDQQLGKDQCLVFLHILNQRSKGKRIPDSLPSALKTSLMRGKLNYNYNETVDPSLKYKSSDGGSQKEKLQRELDDLNEKIKKAEETALSTYTNALSSSSSAGDSGTASEFKQLYEYKQSKLAEVKEKEQLNRTLEDYIRKERLATRELRDMMQSLKNQVSLLENNSESSQSEYNRLQQEISSAKLGR
ncbi:7959_t:CDS:2 [Diversispora eburnea]|uniref:Endocytosis protein 3 n=1 Tax=Diversispora eburnea TaxID=1213867 RepID=A0A9N9FA25_9GLOM|nr:7959_t:CDS:2 [Diversispora eburnea]